MADPAALEQVLALAMHLHARIPGSAPPCAEALLALPGVLRAATPAETDDRDEAGELATIRAGFTEALDQFGRMRAGQRGRDCRRR